MTFTGGDDGEGVSHHSSRCRAEPTSSLLCVNISTQDYGRGNNVFICSSAWLPGRKQPAFLSHTVMSLTAHCLFGTLTNELTWDAAVEAIACDNQGGKICQAPQEGRDISGGQDITEVCEFHQFGRSRSRLLNACQIGTLCRSMLKVIEVPTHCSCSSKHSQWYVIAHLSAPASPALHSQVCLSHHIFTNNSLREI